MGSTTGRGLITTVVVCGALLIGGVVAAMGVPMNIVDPLGYGLAAAVAGMIILVPRLVKAYNLAPWAKLSSWIASFAVLLWCGVGLWESHIHWSLSPSQIKGFTLFTIWVFLSGFSAGTLITLFLSGAFSKTRNDSSPPVISPPAA